jgi:hypothetical protein
MVLGENGLEALEIDNPDVRRFVAGARAGEQNASEKENDTLLHINSWHDGTGVG